MTMLSPLYDADCHGAPPQHVTKRFEVDFSHSIAEHLAVSVIGQLGISTTPFIQVPKY